MMQLGRGCTVEMLKLRQLCGESASSRSGWAVAWLHSGHLLSCGFHFCPVLTLQLRVTVRVGISCRQKAVSVLTCCPGCAAQGAWMPPKARGGAVLRCRPVHRGDWFWVSRFL